jgi:hypothetical protein
MTVSPEAVVLRALALVDQALQASTQAIDTVRGDRQVLDRSAVCA